MCLFVPTGAPFPSLLVVKLSEISAVWRGLVIAKKSARANLPIIVPSSEMMKYRLDSATNSPDLVSSEPHFDDERTLLSARPVVPLEKINSKTRHRKHWFLGGAFAVAMMLGAASALLASYLKMRNVQDAPAAVTQVDVPEAPVAVIQNPPAENPVAAVEEPSPEVTDAEESLAEESTPKKAHVKRRSVVVASAKPDDYVSDQSDSRRMSEQDSLHQIRDNVLYDEWQERRARRVWRREQRRAERYNHRDLSNLDEIFEGRRRSNP